MKVVTNYLHFLRKHIGDIGLYPYRGVFGFVLAQSLFLTQLCRELAAFNEW